MNHGTCPCKKEKKQKCVCDSGYTGKYCQREKSNPSYCKPILPCVIEKAYQQWAPDLDMTEYTEKCKETSHDFKIFQDNFYIACDVRNWNDTELQDIGNAKLFSSLY